MDGKVNEGDSVLLKNYPAGVWVLGISDTIE